MQMQGGVSVDYQPLYRSNLDQVVNTTRYHCFAAKFRLFSMQVCTGAVDVGRGGKRGSHMLPIQVWRWYCNVLEMLRGGVLMEVTFILPTALVFVLANLKERVHRSSRLETQLCNVKERVNRSSRLETQLCSVSEECLSVIVCIRVRET